MESMKLRALVMALMFLGIFVGQSSAAFTDCYTRCFIFCMIDPSETVCKCTTKCLKQCIFNSDSDSGSVSTNNVHNKIDSSNLKFCKLGCALSACSTLSKKHQPNGEKMDDCVGSCSKNCTKSY
ncbi:hypothetical protein MTR67_015679 [Solanum verrucosum]|uniref:Thionin-like protein 2 n=2 Tax=Solanum TaxID=4107 RepID=A0ABQ7VGA9_SOLTU|nr:PREDICTED: thionin-like protein 2 [Solanum tuberosum]XP_049355941.1 thionin-like protein 2 [Solanum verrucosum]KAH0687581.1 hypothetical protein KY284_018134 [Solanum tuberosum]KAH0703860.1 hypothetical protein KY285_018138 [Solanum tuberosum]KAH0763115.1 hypothetical protein KY290_019188 [Solanum tuberosum]WMV22294.1 hypothetical protein MTR67_015679 [Solanum verrucosum]